MLYFIFRTLELVLNCVCEIAKSWRLLHFMHVPVLLLQPKLLKRMIGPVSSKLSYRGKCIRIVRMGECSEQNNELNNHSHPPPFGPTSLYGLTLQQCHGQSPQ